MEKTKGQENGEQLIDSWCDSKHGESNFRGLTKREYFAGLALQGLCANTMIQGFTSDKVVQKAAEVADALLDELSKQ